MDVSVMEKSSGPARFRSGFASLTASRLDHQIFTYNWICHSSDCRH
jgi:hypothetical protein